MIYGWAFSGVFLRWGKGGVPLSKLVMVMSETWNLVGEFRHTFSFRKYTCSDRTPSTSLESAFFCKKLAFLVKKNTFYQSNNTTAVLKSVWFCFQVLLKEEDLY